MNVTLSDLWREVCEVYRGGGWQDMGAYERVGRVVCGTAVALSSLGACVLWVGLWFGLVWQFGRAGVWAVDGIVWLFGK